MGQKTYQRILESLKALRPKKAAQFAYSFDPDMSNPFKKGSRDYNEFVNELHNLRVEGGL